MSASRRVLRRLVEAGDVDAGEVRAAEAVRVGREVAEEVDLLERRAEPARARLQHHELLRGPRGPPAATKARRHISPTTSADPSTYSANEASVWEARCRSMRIDVKNGVTIARSIPTSCAVVANACTTRFVEYPLAIARVGVRLQIVERGGDALGGHPGGRGDAVDDLVREAHERVDVPDVGPGGRAAGGGPRDRRRWSTRRSRRRTSGPLRGRSAPAGRPVIVLALVRGPPTIAGAP